MRLRKVPKPVGGWASRSTSSLSVTICSRASRRVWASRSFCEVTADERTLGVQQPLVEVAGRARAVREPATQLGDLGLEEGDLVQQLGSGRAVLGT